MNVTSSRTGASLTFLAGWILSFGLRLIPFRPPNLETILTVQSPFTKRFGFATGFIFAFANIALFDIMTGKLGLWTLITAVSYGLLALFSVWYFKKRVGTPLQFGLHALYATLMYDAVTSLTIGPLFFGQSFTEAFFGQIPFTAYHLIGNVVLGVLISPLILRWVVLNPRLNFARPWLKAETNPRI